LKTLVFSLAKNPRKIFLIDALGALITCGLLLIIQTKLKLYFGMPVQTLTILSIMAFALFWYSTACFTLFQKINWKQHLKRIASANLIYCGLILFLLLSNFKIVTPFDWIYFLGEIAVIISLVYLEFFLIKHKAQ
jgi:hypothetical protein